MTDLRTTYLGLELKNPLVASPSPLCESVSAVRRMEDAGFAAVVLHSLFEEQIVNESTELDEALWRGTESYSEALSYLPNMGKVRLGPQEYLEHIRRAREATQIPIIASLNGVSPGYWVKFAREIQEAGAHALELNLYYLPTDPLMDGGEVERQYLNVVEDIRRQVSLPLAVKIGPFFSSIPSMAIRFKNLGAQGLVLFNRFYQPDFDLDTLEVVPSLSLSTPQELRLRLRWAAILHGCTRLDLAITGGVHGAHDVAKCLMSGAKVAMMASAILRNGIEHVKRVLREFSQFMEEHEYESLDQLRGSMSHRTIADPSAFERANYIKVLDAYRKRVVAV